MNLISALLTPFLSLILVLAVMPLMRKAAFGVALVDKPSKRKVHSGSIPLVGGITVWLTALFTLFVVVPGGLFATETRYILLASGIMLLLGLIDDKMDLRASLKLLIQLTLAYFAFVNGIRIESFYGIFGIHEIPVFMQYALTVVVITGVINAFNLMDGIDGLAAALALNAFILFAGLAVITGQFLLVYLFLALIGALVGFLRYNLSKYNKVFMGDAGSLFIGTVLVLSALMLLQSAQNTSSIKLVLSVVIGVLTLPVLDSLRVYRRRAKDGFSPFRADRTHFHHLVLQLGINPRSATMIIAGVSVGLIGLSVALGSLTSVTVMVLVILVLFIVISSVLSLHNRVDQWRQKVKQMERNGISEQSSYK
jgi:UDP-GlcNAc:undecaprenyl-phosphate/decaprenyl-phosphate GlcNAc-1-phosphate transferase